jgi:cell wall-associated NlpC family hydrolase
MFGHNVSDEFFTHLEKSNKIYLGQKDGKLILSEDSNNVVAVIVKKKDAEISKLTLEERSEMNHSKKPFVTVGSSKNVSEGFIPNGYCENSEYVGRPFLHGLFDCYTLIRDYYKRSFGIHLPTNIQRNWEWWTQGENLYVENAKSFEFEEVTDVKKHDVLIMKIGSPVPNHGAIYLGNGKILHHLAGRFSTIQELTSTYKHKIAVVYRNKSIKDDN